MKKQVALNQKLENIKKARSMELKLIDSIAGIMHLKRKSEEDYKNSLEGINRELQRYLISDNGFLTEIVKAYQAYITVVYHNQKILIEGYDNQILAFLSKIKESQMEEIILKKVDYVDQQIKDCRQNILNCKKAIRVNQEQLEIINSDIKFSNRLGELDEGKRKAYAQKYNDLNRLKELNEEKLEVQVDSMMELSMLHNQTLIEVQNYETTYLENKGLEVFDNFMRAFVLQVSFIRSLQFDVGNILQKVKEHQEESKKVALDSLRRSMVKEQTIKGYLWDTYKSWTNSAQFDIKEYYINDRIKDKWKRVCEYYNKAC